MRTLTTKIPDYLRERGLEAVRLGDSEHTVVIREIETKKEVGRYTGWNVTGWGAASMDYEEVFERVVKPIVHKYHDQKEAQERA